MITSVSNSQVKYIVQLQKKRSLRKQDGVFVVEGIKLVEEVPKDHGVKLYLSESFYKDTISKRGKAAWLGDWDYEVLSDAVFASCAETQTPQGVLAIVRQPDWQAENQLFSQAENSLYLFLDGIQDPGNLGTILRTSEAAGVTAVIMSADTVDIFNPKVVRATMGAIFRVPFLHVEDIKEMIQKQQKAGVTVYATALEESADYASCDFAGSTAFVMGNEANGIRPQTLQLCDRMLHIPMHGCVESLNVAVATAIVTFEASRQRRLRH